MLLQEKLDNSIVLKTKSKSLKNAGIQSKKERIFSFIIFIFMALFTIYTKIILKDASFDLLVILIITNLITLFLITLIDKSTYGMNHIIQYQGLTLLNKVCKVLIFISTFYTYLAYFKEYIIPKYNMTLFELIFSDSFSIKAIFSLGISFYIKVISFLVSIVLIIPSVLYLIISLFKSYTLYLKFLLFLLLLFIPILNIFVINRYLKNNDMFEYYYISNNRLVIEKRKINNKNFKKKKKIIKFILIIPLISLVIYSYISFILLIIK